MMGSRRIPAAARLLRTARSLWERGLMAGTTGNVSMRRGSTVTITPSRMAYRMMARRDLAVVDLDGRPLRASPAPSRELPLHLAVYRARPDVGAVVHTHSPYATAWSFLTGQLEPRTEDMDYYGVGVVRTAAHAAPGSEALAREAAIALGSSRAALLGRHGVLAVATTLASPAPALRPSNTRPTSPGSCGERFPSRRTLPRRSTRCLVEHPSPRS
jgi:L-fuculose-phosphate aldolase